MAADVWSSRDSKLDPSIRTYVQQYLAYAGRAFAGGPGCALVNSTSMVGKYELAVLGNLPMSPMEVRLGPLGKYVATYPDASPYTLAADAKQTSALNRIIIWQQLPPHAPDPGADDPSLKALGPSWKRTSSQNFPVRIHWTWQDYLTWQRREYVRSPSPDNRPSTAPAPRVAALPLPR
jgi:hypothetical protein